jgi:hypothetical protein
MTVANLATPTFLMLAAASAGMTNYDAECVSTPYHSSIEQSRSRLSRGQLSMQSHVLTPDEVRRIDDFIQSGNAHPNVRKFKFSTWNG